jgi:peptidoglycan/LPS O-acetylase OafA/YrhL
MLAMNVHIKIGNKVSRFLGNISYEIYLLHGIVFGLIGYMIPQINSGMFIVLGIVITIGISVIVHGMSKAILK